MPLCTQVDVLKPYRGGEELRRAAAVLAGPSGGSRSSQVKSSACQCIICVQQCRLLSVPCKLQPQIMGGYKRLQLTMEQIRHDGRTNHRCLVSAPAFL